MVHGVLYVFQFTLLAFDFVWRDQINVIDFQRTVFFLQIEHDVEQIWPQRGCASDLSNIQTYSKLI